MSGGFFYLAEKYTMLRFTLLCLALVNLFCANAQLQNNISIPAFNDKYCKLVEQAESGSKTVDFRDLRFAFLESEQYKYKMKHISEFDSLKKVLFEEI
jgi:hypothetical protein